MTDSISPTKTHAETDSREFNVPGHADGSAAVDRRVPAALWRVGGALALRPDRPARPEARERARSTANFIAWKDPRQE